MLKRLLLATLVLLGLSTLPAFAATTSVATANVNMRAGPSTAYPVVTVVPAGASVITYGCVSGYSWCDVSFGAYRGWVSAGYIQVIYRGAPVALTAPVAVGVGVAVVVYSKAYWDAYYVGYPWYGRWAAYPPYRPPYAAPRVTSHSRSVTCADGACTGTRSTTGIYGGSTSQTRQCAGGDCTATRTTVGPNGHSATRTRNCSRNSASCNVTRTGPRGGTMAGSRTWHR